MFFADEKKKYVDEEMARILNERPQLTHRERRIMRDYLEKEFLDVWESRDYVYGQDDEFAQRGAKN